MFGLAEIYEFKESTCGLVLETTDREGNELVHIFQNSKIAVLVAQDHETCFFETFLRRTPEKRTLAAEKVAVKAPHASRQGGKTECIGAISIVFPVYSRF